MARISKETRQATAEKLHHATREERIATHGEERKKGLKSSRILKALGATALLAGAAAALTGIVFSSTFVTTKLILEGLAGVIWGAGVFIAGNLKGHFNKYSTA